MQPDYVVFFFLTVVLLTTKLFLWRKISWTASFLALGIACHFTIIQFDWGVASPRVYILIGVISFVFLRAMDGKREMLSNADVKCVFVLWLALALWHNVAGAARDELNEGFALNFISDYLISIGVFIVIVLGFRKYEDYKLLALTLVVIAMANIVVGIGQWLNIESAWKAYELVRPLSYEKREVGYNYFSTLSRISGISGSPISMSYAVLSFSPFFLGVVFFSKRATKLVKAMNTLLVIGAFGVLAMTLSRSAVMAYFIQMAICILIYMLYRSKHGGYSWSLIAMFLMTVIASIVVLNATLIIAMGNYDFARLAVMDAPERISMFNAALESFQSEPLFGPGVEGFSKALGLMTKFTFPPHNLILNAMVYLGGPGLVIVVATCYYIFRICHRSAKLLHQVHDGDWILTGSLLGIVGYFVNSFFHNESLVSGAFTLYILLGVCIGIQGVMLPAKTEVEANWGRTRYPLYRRSRLL